uniref:Peptidase n=1 Tax=Globisporangium ultimum (strain ATCC 200006 / CBS 805.95 / DAOM BR144) TaxID=431595 RepID=K3W6W8_GLOUD
MKLFCAAVATAILWLGGVHETDACTMVAVGKRATTDGSTLMAHTDDAGGGAADLRLVRVPAQDHANGSTRAVYSFFGGYPRLVADERGPHYAPKDKSDALTEPLGFIPQVPHTYAYFDLDYGMMNEVQLSIAESTCGARTVGWAKDVSYGYNLFGIAELSKIALERCDSARCAVQTMGDLAVEYGFFSEDSGDPAAPGYVDSAEALGIADKYGEAWIFHVLTGKNNASAVWAAQRVPDDHVSAVANAFVIREMDLNDTDNFMASPNVHAFAQEMGWWRPEDGVFDFTAAYGFRDFDPTRPLYTGRRVWRIFDRVAPSLKLDSRLGLVSQYPTYPFSVKPDTQLSANDVMELYRDYYQDTEYDMSKGMAAGPFGNPLRWDGDNKGVAGGWERPISSFRTMFSFVLQTRSFLPDGVGGVAWFGQSSPHSTVYVPFSCRQSSVPSAYMESVGKQSAFHPKSAWWAFNFVKNWSQLRFDAIQRDIAKKIAELQHAAFEARAVMEKQVQEGFGNSTNATANAAIDAYLEKHANEFAVRVVDQWWQFAWELVGKFADGYVTTGERPEDMATPGYPTWWLAATEYAKWPGDSFTPKGDIKKDVASVGAPQPPTAPSTASTTDEPSSTPAVVAVATSSKDDGKPSDSFSWSLAVVQVGGGVVIGIIVTVVAMWIVEKRRRSGYEALL